MKKIFLTYGDNNFKIAKKHLALFEKESAFFDQVIALGPNDLDYDLKKKYSHIIKQKKGGGYWIWKHRIIQNIMQDLSKNDLVIYCDAGASLNYKAEKRFNEYVEIINSSRYGNFRMKCEDIYKEYQYTTEEIFKYFSISEDSEIRRDTQLQAGHMIFKKSLHTDNYLESYSKLLETNDKLITDYYNEKPQNSQFIENRHDQSIFSLLTKIYGGEIIENETEFKDKPSEQYAYPFLSVRTYGHGIRDQARFYLNKKKYSKKTIFFKNLS